MMSATNEQRDARWFAYLLGDLPEDERAAVEAEMAAAPRESAAFRQTYDGVDLWAREAVEHAPLDVHDTIARAQTLLAANAHPRKTPWYGRALPWAAAAAFLIALSQISFSVQMGDSTFAWGAQPAQEESSQELIDRLRALETVTASAQAELQGLAERAVSIEEEMRDTTAELAYNQQLESEARYRDIARVLTLTGLDRMTVADASFASMYDVP